VRWVTIWEEEVGGEVCWFFFVKWRKQVLCIAIRKPVLWSHDEMELIVFCSNLLAREPSLVWRWTLRSSTRRIVLILKMLLIATRKSVPLKGDPCAIPFSWVCIQRITDQLDGLGMSVQLRSFLVNAGASLEVRIYGEWWECDVAIYEGRHFTSQRRLNRGPNHWCLLCELGRLVQLEP